MCFYCWLAKNFWILELCCFWPGVAADRNSFELLTTIYLTKFFFKVEPTKVFFFIPLYFPRNICKAKFLLHWLLVLWTFHIFNNFYPTLQKLETYLDDFIPCFISFFNFPGTKQKLFYIFVLQIERIFIWLMTRILITKRNWIFFDLQFVLHQTIFRKQNPSQFYSTLEAPKNKSKQANKKFLMTSSVSFCELYLLSASYHFIQLITFETLTKAINKSWCLRVFHVWWSFLLGKRSDYWSRNCRHWHGWRK